MNPKQSNSKSNSNKSTYQKTLLDSVKQEVKGFQVLFCKSGAKQNELVIKLVKPGNKKVQVGDVWKDMGVREVTKQDLHGRRNQILADTNETFHTKFRRIKIELVS